MRKAYPVATLICFTAVAPFGCDAGSTQTLDPNVVTLEQPNQCGSSIERNLANLAAAAADELGRWEIVEDFEVNASRQLQLSPEGANRCGDDCSIVTAVLALQNPEAAAPDHDPVALANAFVQGWELQREHDASSPELEAHTLSPVGSEPGSCGELFWYEALRGGCADTCSFENAAALGEKLVFAGYPGNPYLQFQSAMDWMGREGSLVSVDPTYGPGNDDGGGSNAGCPALCTKISAQNYVGVCCSCNGVNGEYVRSAFNGDVYLCR